MHIMLSPNYCTYFKPIIPFSHGLLFQIKEADSVWFVFTQTIFAAGEQLISDNMAFEELLLILVLCGRRRRARGRRATAVQNILYAVMGLQRKCWSVQV